MHRRRFLGTCGVAATLGLAGCSQSADDGPAGRTTTGGDPGTGGTTTSLATTAGGDDTTATTGTGATTASPDAFVRPVTDPPSPTGGTVDATAPASPHPSLGVDAGNTNAGSGSGPTADLVSEAWSRDLGGSPAAPVIGGDTVYVREGGALYALALADGSTRWTHGDLLGVPAVGEGAAYVGGGEGVRALDPADGSTRWSVATGAMTLSLHGGGLFGTLGRSAVALSAATGEVAWRVRLASEEGRFQERLAVVDGTVLLEYEVFTGRGERGLLALAAEDGTVQWRTPVEEPLAHPVSARGDAAYAVRGSTLTALSLDDGSERWTYDAGEPVTAPPVATDRWVMLATEGSFHTVDPSEGTGTELRSEDGGTRWATRGGGGYFLGLERTYGDAMQMFLGSDRVHAGWEKQVPGSVNGPPALADGHCVVSSGRSVTAIVADSA